MTTDFFLRVLDHFHENHESRHNHGGAREDNLNAQSEAWLPPRSTVTMTLRRLARSAGNGFPTG